MTEYHLLLYFYPTQGRDSLKEKINNKCSEFVILVYLGEINIFYYTYTLCLYIKSAYLFKLRFNLINKQNKFISYLFLKYLITFYNELY